MLLLSRLNHTSYKSLYKAYLSRLLKYPKRYATIPMAEKYIFNKEIYLLVLLLGCTLRWRLLYEITAFLSCFLKRLLSPLDLKFIARLYKQTCEIPQEMVGISRDYFEL